MQNQRDYVIPRVFISYTHDSSDHEKLVRQFADRLRSEGVDATIDQYVESPPEGWPEWMVRQIENADFVLVVCTFIYAARFNRSDTSDSGLGAKWEGALITQALFDAQASNSKFIPVIFEESAKNHIPIVLRWATYYDIGTPEGYQALYHVLAEQHPSAKPPLGSVRLTKPATRALPNLARDVQGSASVILSGTNYVFRVFNIGERGTILVPELVDEVLDGLVERISDLHNSIDYLIAEDPGGIRWALLVARELKLTLKMITSTGSGIKDQVSVTQNEGFYKGRTLWFPRVQQGERTVVIDDVIDTGGTMKTMVQTLRSRGVVVLGIYSIVGKTHSARKLEQELQTPVNCLMEIEGW